MCIVYIQEHLARLELELIHVRLYKEERYYCPGVFDAAYVGNTGRPMWKKYSEIQFCLRHLVWGCLQNKRYDCCRALYTYNLQRKKLHLHYHYYSEALLWVNTWRTNVRSLQSFCHLVTLQFLHDKLGLM